VALGAVCRAFQHWIYLYSPKLCVGDGDPAWYIPEITFPAITK